MRAYKSTRIDLLEQFFIFSKNKRTFFNTGALFPFQELLKSLEVLEVLCFHENEVKCKSPRFKCKSPEVCSEDVNFRDGKKTDISIQVGLLVFMKLVFIIFVPCEPVPGFSTQWVFLSNTVNWKNYLLQIILQNGSRCRGVTVNQHSIS